MRIISRRTLREFATQHADAAEALDQWYATAHVATWRNLAEVRQVYPHADLVDNKTVFNIRGNHYRLLTAIHYNRGSILFAPCSLMQSMTVVTGGNAENSVGWNMTTRDAVLLKVSDTLSHSPDAETLADYLTHTVEFPLASIRSDAQLEQAIGKINTLVDQPELSPGDEMYLYALADLVEFYESERIAIPEVRCIDILRHLMEANDLQVQDLVPLLGSESVVSALLEGKRPLTLSQIARLSDRFGLPADLFIDRSAVSNEEDEHAYPEQP